MPKCHEKSVTLVTELFETDRRKGITKLIVASRSFAKMRPKSACEIGCRDSDVDKNSVIVGCQILEYISVIFCNIIRIK